MKNPSPSMQKLYRLVFMFLTGIVFIFASTTAYHGDLRGTVMNFIGIICVLHVVFSK